MILTRFDEPSVFRWKIVSNGRRYPSSLDLLNSVRVFFKNPYESKIYLTFVRETSRFTHKRQASQYKSDLKKISAAVNAGKQVLVAVDGGELIGNPFEEKLEDALVGGIADHYVVVLNCNEKDNKVMLFNPAFGDIPLTVSSETFLDAWEDSGNFTIEVSRQKSS